MRLYMACLVQLAMSCFSRKASWRGWSANERSFSNIFKVWMTRAISSRQGNSIQLMITLVNMKLLFCIIWWFLWAVAKTVWSNLTVKLMCVGSCSKRNYVTSVYIFMTIYFQSPVGLISLCPTETTKINRFRLKWWRNPEWGSKKDCSAKGIFLLLKFPYMNDMQLARLLPHHECQENCTAESCRLTIYSEM